MRLADRLFPEGSRRRCEAQEPGEAFEGKPISPRASLRPLWSFNDSADWKGYRDGT